MRTSALDIGPAVPTVRAMATEDGGNPHAAILRVGPVSEERWTLNVDDDPTPISEHATRADAEVAARQHAQMFGYGQIVVYGLDGDHQTIIVDDAGPQPPSPGGAIGEAATP